MLQLNYMIQLGLGYNTNKDSNDYLRRLWAVIRKEFGKMAWNFTPLKANNTVYLGFADINAKEPAEFRLVYGKKGCLKSIVVNAVAPDIACKMERCLKMAIKEQNTSCFTMKYEVGRQCMFQEFKGKHFSVKGNTITMSIRGYDITDAEYVCADRVQTVCAILSFYLLYPIAPKGSFANDLIGWQKRELSVSDNIAEAIDEFLGREYNYEHDVSLFESAMLAFAQGVIAEKMTSKINGLGYPFAETAIVNYMSALEIITTNDIEPAKCPECGQLRFSIARRVMNLAISYNPDMEERIKKWIKGYYDIRSRNVHTGMKMSRNNYTGITIPLMSEGSESGAIMQVSVVTPSLKEDVRNMILFHENLPIIDQH